MPHALFARSAHRLHSGLLQARVSCAAQQTVSTQRNLFNRAAFASAADAVTKKEGSEAKKEAKKSALETALGALKVHSPLTAQLCIYCFAMHLYHYPVFLQTIVTSRAAVLVAGGACLLVPMCNQAT